MTAGAGPVAAGLLGLSLLATACGDGKTEIDVFAASSLTDAYRELEVRFEADHPDVDVRLNLAGSNALRRQIDDGAGADVFAPADIARFDGLEVDPVRYAENALTLVVPVDNPAAVGSVDELHRADLIVARCATGVPCGDATDEVLSRRSIELTRPTTESNVRSVLTKVRLGEVGAGFVYRTDALAAGADVVDVGLDPTVTTVLAVAPLTDRPAALDFATFVVSDEARPIFQQLGFDQP